MNQKFGEKPRLPGVIMPQLVKPIEEEQLDRFLDLDGWWMQEQVGGERRLIANEGNGKWSSWNKNGDMLDLPAVIVEELNHTTLMADTVIDGNILGDVYHPFDVLRLNGSHMMPKILRERAVALLDVPLTEHVRPLSFFRAEDVKKAAFAHFEATGSEGVVFKHSGSEYNASQLKHSFQQSATFQVIKSINTSNALSTRRILIGAYDDGRVLTEMGFVLIADNQEAPREGEMVEIGYLHAIKNGGLENPVYLGVRNDQFAQNCLLSKLKHRKFGSFGATDTRWSW